MPTNCLSVHAKYACRHAGACCRTWTIPAEPRVIRLVDDGHLGPMTTSGGLFVRSGNSDAGWQIARRADGSCVFLSRDSPALCAIHRAAGAEALPTSCRHFPRTFLRDRRGTFISLSHFCPTAASMLLTPVPLAVVDAEPPLALDEPIEGLDATDALPPLVRPGLLSDLEGYDAWERNCIAVCAREDLSWRQALDAIAAATETARAWEPGRRTMADEVASAFADPRPAPDAAAEKRAAKTAELLVADRLPDFSAVPAMTANPDGDSGATCDTLNDFDRAMKNYLAARVFANWIAYQGRGLRSVVEWLRTCAALVALHAERSDISAEARFVEAVRSSDHLMLHVVDTTALARRFAHLEGPDPR